MMQRPQTVTYPIEHQACSTWALSGDESSARNIHREFEDLTAEILKKPSNLGDNIKEQRQEVMRKICALRDPTEHKVEKIYFCGGYMETRDIVPSHYWIEDHTNVVTTDTFINRSSAVAVFRVGVEGEKFKPGCEGGYIEADNIARVPIDGYTKGQIDILTNYTRPENVVKGVIGAKRAEIESLKRALDAPDGYRYMLNHLEKYPHRNNPVGIKGLNADIARVERTIKELEREVERLEANPPVKPALPETESGHPIDIMRGRIYNTMQEALQARQRAQQPEVRQPQQPEVRQAQLLEVSEVQQNRSLLSSLNSTLGMFVASVAVAALAVGVVAAVRRSNPS
jgi:hypothetical protein